MAQNFDRTERIRELEEKLAKYLPVYEEKKRNFRGVKHENSLSELRYTEFMVYQDIVAGLRKELTQLKGEAGAERRKKK